MFQLSPPEKDEVVANCDHLAKLKFSKALPFTEHGALMAASVLNTPRAVEVSVYVVRAFVALRELLTGNKELTAKLNELAHKVHDYLSGLFNHAIAGFIQDHLKRSTTQARVTRNTSRSTPSRKILRQHYRAR